MPHELKCQACRKSKKRCERDGGNWNELNRETRCNRCKARDLCCGPDEFIFGAEKRRGVEDIGGTESSNPVPYRPIYSKADLQRRMSELSNSGPFNFIRETLRSKQNISVPEELCRELKDIADLADLAHDSGDIFNAELAYRKLIDWYTDLGPEAKELKEGCWIKLGNFSEEIGHKYDAEIWYLKIFDDIEREFFDQHIEFHHAIRNFKTKGQASQNALMGIIRCCQLARFKVRNGEDQTPLFLAVARAEEPVIIAILKRLLRDPRPVAHCLIEPIYLDARSYGIPLLSAAIMSSCKLGLIEALIVCGCNVNPQTMPGILTPLQASLHPQLRRFEVAWLLDRYQVHWEDLAPNSEVNAQSIHEIQTPVYDSLLLELNLPLVAQIEN